MHAIIIIRLICLRSHNNYVFVHFYGLPGRGECRSVLNNPSQEVVMSKTRINKFIFNEKGFFLRLKTESKDLKVKKIGEGYIMELPTHSDKGNKTKIPVVSLESILNQEAAKCEAVSLGCEKDNLEKATDQKDFFWGEVVKIKDFKTDMHTYYLLNKGEGLSVRIGPIHKGVDGSKIEMDFENLQWVKN